MDTKHRADLVRAVRAELKGGALDKIAYTRNRRRYLLRNQTSGPDGDDMNRRVGPKDHQFWNASGADSQLYYSGFAAKPPWERARRSRNRRY